MGLLLVVVVSFVFFLPSSVLVVEAGVVRRNLRSFGTRVLRPLLLDS